MSERHRRQGKFLAYVLRHRPEEAGLSLDPEGWSPVATVLEALKRQGMPLAPGQLEELVASDSKGRFSLRDGRIRANQGHSVAVQAVDLTPVPPPGVLFHGTSQANWEKIQASSGLLPGRRHHVHLSGDVATARQVGSRHGGTLRVLRVDSAAMAAEHLPFYRSENGVWLTDSVPLRFLTPQP